MNTKEDKSQSSTARTGTPATDGEDAIPFKKRLAANTNVGFQAKSMSKNALLREAQTKEQLRKEFLAIQERVKATDFMMPFVFYAGKDIPGGACRMKKGDLVWLFLDRARKVGAEVSSSDRSRREWARVSVDDLMLVRGDLIIPHVRILSIFPRSVGEHLGSNIWHLALRIPSFHPEQDSWLYRPLVPLLG